MVQFSSFSTFDKEFRNCFVSKTYQWITSEIFTSKAYQQATSKNFQISFLKGISWDICFILLTSSPKPLFLCFYIKTQLNSTVFHSFNISKVIFNSFLFDP